ncbi:hypothetical protein PCH_Pc16g12220 [Penicillium rubens Wisconsin 54-1255]|uniref:C2H2-type domain-containing protein n=1 Tax=Penicillium rubens (strain ATCC 28089 / DSM 1075 / NRRL 1951 / Wisconsin 54-1255) TaxID=500485 RepID=B6HAB3_PENRW|nr:hypothetical protein PCH_Pc16g12220 [Penicillium rubens Wisconsin 54-1255]
MAPDQSKQQTSRSLDETQPSPNRFASEELNSMAWSKWIGCVYNPDLTATEFLERWNQAYKHTRAHLMSLDTDIPNTIQYWQFLEAVHSHPDLEQWYPDVDWESKEAISMDQVRSQFLEVAIKIPARKRVVALVARSSSGSRMEKDDYLLWSLEWTKLFYEKIYGKIQSECRFLTFVQSSNTPLRPTGEVSSFFASLRNEVEEYEGELLIVVNGWDGLTTDRMSFYNLFSHWAERITLRIYSQESIWQRKKFFEVNVAQVCSVFRGEIEFDIEDLNNDFSLKDSTALFIRRFSAIPLIKEDISVVSTELRALTNVRNEQPESRNLSKHICGDCNIPFPTSVDLNRHMHHKHEKHENPEMDLRYILSASTSNDIHSQQSCERIMSKVTASDIKRPRLGILTNSTSIYTQRELNGWQDGPSSGRTRLGKGQFLQGNSLDSSKINLQWLKKQPSCRVNEHAEHSNRYQLNLLKHLLKRQGVAKILAGYNHLRPSKAGDLD